MCYLTRSLACLLSRSFFRSLLHFHSLARSLSLNLDMYMRTPLPGLIASVSCQAVIVQDFLGRR